MPTLRLQLRLGEIMRVHLSSRFWWRCEFCVRRGVGWFFESQQRRVLPANRICPAVIPYIGEPLAAFRWYNQPRQRGFLPKMPRHMWCLCGVAAALGLTNSEHVRAEQNCPEFYDEVCLQSHAWIVKWLRDYSCLGWRAINLSLFKRTCKSRINRPALGNLPLVRSTFGS